VLLNVGGKVFQTSRSTLTSDSDSMLATMFHKNSVWNSMRDQTGAYCFDQDPKYFRPILNYLRTGQLVLDKNTNPEGAYATASFFQVKGVMDLLNKRAESADPSNQQIVMIVLYSGIMYVTGKIEKSLVQKHPWVSGVHKFTPGGTDSYPCFQMQGKSGNLNRGHLLEVLEDFLSMGWQIVSSDHDMKSKSDQYTLVKMPKGEVISRPVVEDTTTLQNSD